MEEIAKMKIASSMYSRILNLRNPNQCRNTCLSKKLWIGKKIKKNTERPKKWTIGNANSAKLRIGWM